MADSNPPASLTAPTPGAALRRAMGLGGVALGAPDGSAAPGAMGREWGALQSIVSHEAVSPSTPSPDPSAPTPALHLAGGHRTALSPVLTGAGGLGLSAGCIEEDTMARRGDLCSF